MITLTIHITMKINYTAPKVMAREMKVEDVIPTERRRPDPSAREENLSFKRQKKMSFCVAYFNRMTS